MANENHLKLIQEGATVWNHWRKQFPNIRPDLRGADLQQKELTGIDLSGADLLGTNFEGALLSRADFTRTYASRANFAHTNLTSAIFTKSNLFQANFHKANLFEADLFEAVLSESVLSYANLGSARLNKANLSLSDMSNSDFNNAYLSKVNLSESKLCNARLYKANCFHANLSRANLTDANLRAAVLSEADFYHAILVNANLTKSNMHGANFTEANLEGADISGANFTNVRIFRATLPTKNDAKTVQANLILSPEKQPTILAQNICTASAIIQRASGKSRSLDNDTPTDTPAATNNIVPIIINLEKSDDKDLIEALQEDLIQRGFSTMIIDNSSNWGSSHIFEIIEKLSDILAFIIFDITDVKSNLQRLRTLAEHHPGILMVPLVSIWEFDNKLQGQLSRYANVQEIIQYNIQEDLLKRFDTRMQIVKQLLELTPESSVSVKAGQAPPEPSETVPPVAEETAPSGESGSYKPTPPNRPDDQKSAGDNQRAGQEAKVSVATQEAPEPPEAPLEITIKIPSSPVNEAPEPPAAVNNVSDTSEPQVFHVKPPKAQAAVDPEVIEEIPKPTETPPEPDPPEKTAAEKNDAVSAEHQEPPPVEEEIAEPAPTVIEAPPAPATSQEPIVVDLSAVEKTKVIIKPSGAPKKRFRSRRISAGWMLLLVVLVISGYWLWHFFHRDIMVLLPQGIPSYVHIDGKLVEKDPDELVSNEILVKNQWIGKHQLDVYPTQLSDLEAFEFVRYQLARQAVQLSTDSDLNKVFIAFDTLYSIRKLTNGSRPGFNDSGDKLIFVRRNNDGRGGLKKSLMIRNLANAEEYEIRIAKRSFYLRSWERPIMMDNDRHIYLAAFSYGKGYPYLIDAASGRLKQIPVRLTVRGASFLPLPDQRGILVGNTLYDINGSEVAEMFPGQPYQNRIFYGGENKVLFLEEENTGGRERRLEIKQADLSSGSVTVLSRIFKAQPPYLMANKAGNRFAVSQYSGLNREFYSRVRLLEAGQTIDLTRLFLDGQHEFADGTTYHITEAALDAEGRKIVFDYESFIYIIDIPQYVTIDNLKIAELKQN